MSAQKSCLAGRAGAAPPTVWGMPELDHLVFASPNLAAGVRHIEELTGATPVPGGPHPGVGTRNHLLTFDQTTYFEVIGVDPDQAEPARPRPFGIDEGRPPRLAGYALHPAPGETIEEVVERLRALGHDPGPVTAMNRVKPDGEELRWRLTLAPSATAPSALPFVIDWGSNPSPARSLPSMGTLVELRVEHPDTAVRSMVDGLKLGIVTVEAASPRLVAVVDTPGGRVEIA